MTMHRYQPRSPLQAADPKAFLGLFAAVDDPENEDRDDAVIVTIRGPLTQHSSWWEDSYQAIRGRVAEACESSAPVVVLSIDSPGGDVHGLFDTVRAIRATCDAAGKRLVAHIEGQGCSAAYALATAADRIVASRTAEVGSIGVVAARIDETRALDEMGIQISLITSGDRKADGWACSSMSKDELAALQSDVDGLAGEFFAVVSMARGISIDGIAAQEAATFRGAAALDAGLIDELGSFDHLLATLAGTGETMSKEEEAREALRSMAEDEECSEEEREKARKALAALDDDESAEDDEGAEDESDDESAADEDDDESAEDDKQAASAPPTVSAATAGAIADHGVKLEDRVARLESRDRAETIKGMIAAHGGVTPKMAKLVGKMSVKEAKAILSGIEKPKKPKLGDHAATTTVTGTRGNTEGRGSELPPNESLAVKRAMGLSPVKTGVVKRGGVLLFGAELDEEGGES